MLVHPESNMDVVLYVYDLSRGMARQLSQSFLGTHIDAVYHTSLVFNNIEYFFGQGVQTCLPGTTHHGQPMEKIPLGQTQLPIEVILEYLDSLKTIYTAESYDLFLHNCNNFSNDFAMFLVGKGIPNHITSLPQTVLNTPFGQMLKPQLDQALRGVTQAPVAPPPSQARSHTNGASARKSLVHTPKSLSDLMPLLEQALKNCAVLFFTSQTCPPCKICYEPFERLAEEFEGKATLIKVDISHARDIAMQYSIRATPTFITILRGEQQDQWSGADVSRLQSSTRMLVQMAYPPHRHLQLNLSTIQREYKASVHSKVPPLDKLLAKLEPEVRGSAEVEALKSFVSARTGSSKPANFPIPDLACISSYIREMILEQPPNKIFPLIDLIRLALLDVRVSGFFAEETSSKSLLYSLVAHGVELGINAGSYPFLLTTIQALSNVFTSPLALSCILGNTKIQTFVSDTLLATEYPALRAASANLVFNIAAAEHKQIMADHQGTKAMEESTQLEFLVGIVEGLNQEINREAAAEKTTIRALTLSIGLCLYCAPQDSLNDWKDIFESVEAKTIIGKAGKFEGLTEISKDVLQLIP